MGFIDIFCSLRMTSIGKGRGWPRVTDRENLARPPGQLSSPISSELDNIISRIYSDLQIGERTSIDRHRDLAAFIGSLVDSQTIKYVC